MTRKTTILYLDHTARMGGGEIAILSLARALDGMRYNPIVILASDGPLAGEFERSGIETHILSLDPSVVETRKDTLRLTSVLRIKQVWLVLLYAFRLARWTQGRNIDIIHTNSLKSDIYGGLAGRLARIPVIWHVRDNIGDPYLPQFAARIFRFLARHIPSFVVANSESTLRTLRIPDSNRTAVAYSGVTSIVEHPSADTAWPDAPVVALIGRIAEWKGQHVFIRAASEVLRKYPRTRFWIIGSPLFGEEEYEASLHTLAGELQIEECVEFLGFRNDVQSLLNDVSIVVHASISPEPFGQVVVQGMAAGKPVIATNGGALPEIVIPGQTGMLVPMGDSAALADALQWMFAHRADARAMALAGHERVRTHFTIEQTVAKMQTVYDSLMVGSMRMRNEPGSR